MCKIIKKQIIKSMPVFVIVCLVTSTVAFGLFFNLDLRVYVNEDDRLAVSLGAPEAQAQDWATTTVKVLNAAPNITVSPAESPVSTSTSPVNVGSNINFTMTASDPEANFYFLIVCDTPSVTPHNGGAPTCDSVQFCRSASTTSGVATGCSYTNVADPGAQTDDWYAYACDDHGTEADCSAVSQGAAPGIGDSSSPFYVNHAPTFHAVSTTDDNKDPGGTFEVTGIVTDIDTADQPDEVYMYICGSSVWATSTGCFQAEWCSGTTTNATLGANIVCSFATTTPALDGTWEYNAFVKDWHNMPATLTATTSDYTVNNVAPQVSDVDINDGYDVTLAAKTMDEVMVYATSTSITDNNSCMDIVSATGTVYLSSLAAQNNCADDPNSCYQIESTNCAYLPGSCTGPSDIDATYTCTTTLKFHTIPTSAGGLNPNALNEWLAAITAEDDDGLKGTGTTTAGSGVDVNQLLAIEVYVGVAGEANSQIAYGSVRGGQDTDAYNATTTVENYGNVPMDPQIAVSDMIKDDDLDYIEAINQEFDLINFSYTSGTYTVASTSSQIVPTVTNKPTNEAVPVIDNIYWGIGIPAGTLSGDYSGSNTFSATVDTANW